MSMTFATEESIHQPVIDEWQGTILWRSTKNPYRPGHKRSNWFVGVNFFDEVSLPQIDESDIIYETCRSGGKAVRMSTKSRQQCEQFIPQPDYQLNALMNAPNRRIRLLQENAFY